MGEGMSVDYDRGEQIPGSSYFRNYCCLCGERLRVTKDRRLAKTIMCNDCNPPHIGVGRPYGSPITSDERNEYGGYA
jgi:predicted RNA-binding Zn-ribbon protein involved in translation (DUF1610 family)